MSFNKLKYVLFMAVYILKQSRQWNVCAKRFWIENNLIKNNDYDLKEPILGMSFWWICCTVGGCFLILKIY